LSSTLPTSNTLSTVSYAGADATVYLGPTNVADGLTQIAQADGPTGGTFLGNHDCRTNGGLYVYFRIADTFCVSNSAGQAATVEVEYYDNTSGALLRLQHDSLTAAYTTHPVSVTTVGTGGWKNFRWTVTNAFFGNRQNGQSDFRLNITPAGKTVGIRRASVFLPEETKGTAVAGAPALQFSNGRLNWSGKADATGWGLSRSGNLVGGNWQEVTPPTNWLAPGPFSITNGTIQYQPPLTNSAGFYRLGRPTRQ
jgi:hypothetical protein